MVEKVLEIHKPCNFESVSEQAILGHQVLLKLMAIKVLQDLKDIQHTSFAFRGTPVPQEITSPDLRESGHWLWSKPLQLQFHQGHGRRVLEVQQDIGDAEGDPPFCV